MHANFAHASMQFSDSPAQKKHDVEALADRALEKKWRWLTGTEAGPGDNRVLARLLESILPEAGYRVHVGQSDGWVAVQEGFIAGGWSPGYLPVFGSSSSTGSSRKHGPKGVTTTAWNTDRFGRFHLATAHPLTRGRVPGPESRHGKADHYALNGDIADTIREWAKEACRGDDIAMFGGDMNTPDDKHDVFRGGPMVSLGDKLGKHPLTGHGPIDVLGICKWDSRVTPVSIRSFTDKQFFMYSDHFLLEGAVKISPLDGAGEEPEHHACPDCGRVHIVQE